MLGHMKKTLVKVYVHAHHFKKSDDIFILGDSDYRVLIGEERCINTYIEENGCSVRYKEYMFKNSICDLADYNDFDARIEPGAIIRQSADIKKDAIIMMGAVINKGASIGAGTMIDMNCVIGGNVKIGDYCHIGAGSVLAGNIEPYSDKCVEIEDGVFVGANAVIVEGVHVGKNAVIGAGSIVLHDVLENTAVAGNPAKVIKERDDDLSKKIAINMNLR